jgi:hypothetical protein
LILEKDMTYEPRLAYWLRGNDQRPENRDLAFFDVFRTTILHALVYEPILVLSDSDVVNGVCFRHALKTDQAISQFCTDGRIRVACRKAAKRASLVETLQRFVANGKRPQHFPQPDYEDFSSLEDLERNAKSYCFLEYSFDGISRNFTNEVLTLFNESTSRARLGDKVVDVILGSIREEMAKAAEASRLPPEQGTIGLNYLYYAKDGRGNEGLGSILNKHFNGIWIESPAPNETVRFIREIGRGPYLTGLPAVTNSNPIYAEDQRFAIENWRRRSASQYASLRKARVRSVMDLTTYVRAVGELNEDRLAELRNTDQWREYKTYLDNGVDAPNIADFQNAYLAYRYVVEEHMCRWLSVGRSTARDAGEVSTEIELDSPRGRGGWLKTLIADYAVEKIPGMDESKLLKSMFQPLGRLKASDPREAHVLDVHRMIENERAMQEELEQNEPRGRIRSETAKRGDTRETFLDVDVATPPELRPMGAQHGQVRDVWQP